MLAARFLAPLAFVIAAALPHVASAQSSLGFQDASLTVTYAKGETTTRKQVDAALDVAITGYHGLQLDIGAADYPDRYWGRLGAHLYIDPGHGAKYGLFANVADANNLARWDATLGAEGIWVLGETVTLAARAGLGLSEPGNYDYIFAEVRGTHRLSKTLDVYAGYARTDIDEAGLDFTSGLLEAGVTHHLPGSAAALSLGLERSIVSGNSGAVGDTRLVAGLTVQIGTPRGAKPTTTATLFAPVRPLDEALLRQLLK